VREAIGHKDSSGLQALLADAPLGDQSRREILALPRLFGGREVLAKAEQTVRNDRSRRALENLAKVLDVLAVYGVEEHVTLALGELRGLDYHTGLTFQGFLPGLGRAVCFGGRYDKLTARYGFPAAATGFAFNLLNLLFALDRELDAAAVESTDVLIFQTGPGKETAQRAAQSLRARGYSAARDIIQRGLEESLEYARRMNFRFVMVIGGDSAEILLIRLSDGSQRRLSYQTVVSEDFAL
jgi:ATP phosphoribosyltransferase regulatory subunit